MKLINNYRENDLLRNSFIELASDIFGLHFKTWHDKGYWDGRYIPYSYTDGDKIIANVSVNRLNFIMNGKSYRALQIGTVMTHPDYRNRGFSAGLMNHILEEYKDQYDFMYLFANGSVLDFYPKFGFARAEEVQYSLNYAFGKQETALRRLDIDSPSDLQLIEKAVRERVPVSAVFGTINTGGITMYHILNAFFDDLHYSEDQDAIVIFSKNDSAVHLLDVISRNPVKMETILNTIADRKTKEIVFHYTPDHGLEYECRPYHRDGALFVKTNGELHFPLQVKHPITSEA